MPKVQIDGLSDRFGEATATVILAAYASAVMERPLTYEDRLAISVALIAAATAGQLDPVHLRRVAEICRQPSPKFLSTTSR